MKAISVLPRTTTALIGPSLSQYRILLDAMRRVRSSVPEPHDWGLAAQSPIKRAGTDVVRIAACGETGSRSAMIVMTGFITVLSGLTPELSRTAARNGGVVQVTMQPSREAVSA